MKRILITGGSGFLGRHLAVRLSTNNKVLLGARNNANNMMAELKTGCTVVPMDITNEKSIRDVLNEFRPDTIIHAASSTVKKNLRICGPVVPIFLSTLLMRSQMGKTDPVDQAMFPKRTQINFVFVRPLNALYSLSIMAFEWP